MLSASRIILKLKISYMCQKWSKLIVFVPVFEPAGLENGFEKPKNYVPQKSAWLAYVPAGFLPRDVL